MRNTFIILTISILTLSACRTKREVAQVWDYVQEQPDSALMVLNTMDASAFHGRTLAEYRLLKAMALDKNYVNVASDSLAMPAYQFFRRYGPKEKEMMSLYYLGVVRYNAGDFSNAILMLEEASDMAERQGNLLYVGLSNNMKSYAFIRTYCYSEAVKSAEFSVDAFRAIPDTFRVQRTKVQLADVYHATKEFKKALDIFQDLIRSCQNDTVIMRRALIHGAYSMYLAYPERADSAMYYYERALNDYKASLGTVEAAHLGEVATMIGNTQLAPQIVDQLKASGKRQEQRAYLEYKLLLKENKPWESLAATEEFLYYQDSVVVKALEQSLIKSQRNYQEQRRRASEQALYLTKWIGIVCVLCLILALMIVWLYYSRKQRIAAFERELLISHVGETSRLLRESEQKNLNMAQSLREVQRRYVSAYKKQFSKISSIIENYYTSSGKNNSRDIVYKQVMDIAATIGSDQTRMSILEKDVNLALTNAMELYREEFPGKSADHYKMVCLFMAGFTISMMEILTGTLKNTLYSRKSRILEEIRNSDVEHKELFLMVIK